MVPYRNVPYRDIASWECVCTVEPIILRKFLKMDLQQTDGDPALQES